MLSKIEKKFLLDVREREWNFSFKEWKQFSDTTQKTEDLILRALCSTKDGSSLVKTYLNKNSYLCLCYTYACQSQYINDDILKELAFISSCFFSFNIYEKRYIDVIYEIIKGEYGNPQKYIDKYTFNDKEKKFLNKLINMNLHKYPDKIDYVSIFNNPNIHLSDVFIKENKDYMINACRDKIPKSLGGKKLC